MVRYSDDREALRIGRAILPTCDVDVLLLFDVVIIIVVIVMLIIFRLHPLVGDPLGADQNRATSVDCELVGYSVRVKVPPGHPFNNSGF